MMNYTRSFLVHSFADDVNRRGGGREFGFGWLVDANRTGESVSQSLYLGDFSRGRIWCRIIDHHWLQRGGVLSLGTPLLASLMALLACLPIYFLGQRQGMTPQILVLSGIVVLFFFQSLQSLMLFRPHQKRCNKLYSGCLAAC